MPTLHEERPEALNPGQTASAGQPALTHGAVVVLLFLLLQEGR